MSLFKTNNQAVDSKIEGSNTMRTLWIYSGCVDRLFLSNFCIVLKLMNFWVAKMHGNNGMSYGDTNNIDTVVTKHFHN